MRVLRIAAGVEAASLVALLANLVSSHAEAITTLVGPLHGMAYLVVIVATVSAPTAASSGARWRATIPGIGGLLALRQICGRSPAKRPETHDATET